MENEETVKVDNQIFRSQFSIGQQVYFSKRNMLESQLILPDDKKEGKIIAIKFTRTGEFYDIMNEFDNRIYSDINSENINKP